MFKWKLASKEERIANARTQLGRTVTRLREATEGSGGIPGTGFEGENEVMMTPPVLDFIRNSTDAEVAAAVEKAIQEYSAGFDRKVRVALEMDELADMAGVGPRVAAITARAMNGELNFHEALVERVGLLAGLRESVVAEVLDRRITLTPGGRELVATMRANGGHAALASGGFTAFTGAVAERLGFDTHRANTLLSEAGVLTGHVALPVLGREAKVEALREIAAGLGRTPEDAIAVGDGANDLGMLQLAGTGVALHAKQVVAAQAKIRINHGDLSALLYLQGYRAAEFVGG